MSINQLERMAMNLPVEPTTFSLPRYAAFISYNHADRRCAEWLHRSLEAWTAPRGLPTHTKNPLRPVFIDRAELSTSTDLAASVRDALERSEFLIVVCSPAAARSKWVNEEVRLFKSLGREQRILCLIVDGEPAGGLCFPAALRFDLYDGQVTDRPATEPLAADIRPGMDSRADAKLKLIAGLLGLPLDRLRQRDAAHRQKRLAAIATGAAVGCVLFGVLAAVALLAKREADSQRLLAERQSLTARRTADFMKSLFAVSDPSEARGNSVTAREVLDRGAQQIERQLGESPLIRADLRTTLGEVYASLGLLNQGLQLLESAAATPDKPASMSVRIMTALGELHGSRGDYDAALGALDSASEQLRKDAAPDNEVRARLLFALGRIYSRQNDTKTAREYLQQTIAVTQGLLPNESARSMQIRAQHGIAKLDLADGRFDEAASELQVALQDQIRLTGERHPLVTDILNDMGSLEYLRNRPKRAEEFFRRCLANDKLLLGERHPAIAPSINNLARVLLEQREFSESRALLQESVEIRRSEVLETADEMAFSFSNLALTFVGAGDLAAAEPLLLKGLRAAEIHKHRLIAPISTDLANLECQTGRVEEGLERLSEARPAMTARYPDDPWRAAYVDNVRAGCMTKARRYPEAVALMADSAPVILKRWPVRSMIGHDTVARALALYERSGDRAELARYRKMIQQSESQ